MPQLIAVRLDAPLALPLPVPRLVSRLARTVRRWPVQSQQVSRRNAMVACTALADRRAEREDVESYLRGLPVAAQA